MSGTQARRWMLTINNPTFKESEVIETLGNSDYIKYMCWCAENADEEDHTPHYHVYVSLKKPWRFSRFKTLLPRARIEMAKKNELACFRYLTKGNREHTVEPFYREFGYRNTRTGEIAEKRKGEDLAREEVLKRVRQKQMRIEDFTEDQFLDSKLMKACELVLKCTMGPYRDDLKVCVIVSPTGWGKSYSIWSTFGEVCTCEFSSSQEWFINAEKEVMLFDEFCGQIRCQKMLKYLDKYPIALPIKGGHRPCYWRRIFICSNTTPDEWYTKINERTGMRESTIPDDVRNALYRRIGYGQQTDALGETHIFDPMMYSKDQARQEMVSIVCRLAGVVEHEELPDDSPVAIEDDDSLHEDIDDLINQLDTQEERRQIGY